MLIDKLPLVKPPVSCAPGEIAWTALRGHLAAGPSVAPSLEAQVEPRFENRHSQRPGGKARSAEHCVCTAHGHAPGEVDEPPASRSAQVGASSLPDGWQRTSVSTTSPPAPSQAGRARVDRWTQAPT